MAETATKTCRGCGSTLPKHCFPEHPTTRDGYRNYCKKCVAAVRRARYEASEGYRKVTRSYDVRRRK